MSKTYYKVTWGLRSWNDQSFGYSEKVEVRAPVGTKLFIFDSLDNLRSMVDGYPETKEYCRYWKCTAKGVSRPKYMAEASWLTDSFWATRNAGKSLTKWGHAKEVFKGTLFCDSLVLTEEICFY